MEILKGQIKVGARNKSAEIFKHAGSLVISLAAKVTTVSLNTSWHTMHTRNGRKDKRQQPNSNVQAYLQDSVCS